MRTALRGGRGLKGFTIGRSVEVTTGSGTTLPNRHEHCAMTIQNPPVKYRAGPRHGTAPVSPSAAAIRNIWRTGAYTRHGPPLALSHCSQPTGPLSPTLCKAVIVGFMRQRFAANPYLLSQEVIRGQIKGRSKKSRIRVTLGPLVSV